MVDNTTGSNNTAVGDHADVTSNWNYATVIGSGATVAGSNKMALGGNSSTTYTFVGIGTNNPIADLVIADANTGTGSSTNCHVRSEGAAPAVTTSYTTATMATNSTDVAGTVSATGIIGNGTIVVTFNKTYNVAPVVVLTPATCNAASFASYVYVTSTSSTFTINFCNMPTTLTGPGSWNYHVIEAY